jgi:hypothetical protein
MATGGRTIPSITGGGLSRAAGAIFEAKVAKRELAQRDRQIDIQESQNALAQITALIPHLAEGTTLGDLDPASQIQFGKGLGIDPAEYQPLVLNKLTLAEFTEALTLNRVSDLTPEEAARDEFLRALAGVEPLAEVSDLQRGVAQIQIDGLVGLSADPARVLEFQQRFQGLDPITVTFPNGDTMDFDRNAEAQLYVTLLGQESSSEYEFAKLDAAVQAEAVDNIQRQMELRQFVIGDAPVMRLFAIYDQAIAAEKQTPGSGQQILNAFAASGASPGEKIAMNLVSGAIPFGDQFLLGDLPPEVRRGAALAELLVQIESADPEQLQGLLEQLPEAAFGSITRQGPFSFLGFGQPIFNLGDSGVDGGAAGTGTPPPDSPLTREESIQAARENLGTTPRDELVARLGSSVVEAAEALGEIKPGDTPPPTPPLPDEPPEPDEPVPAAEPGVDPADRAAVLTSEQRQLDRLIQLRANNNNPAAVANIDARIQTLDAEIAIQQAVVPFGPDRLIIVDSVPASARAAAARYNSIQNLLNRSTSAAGRRARVRALEPLLREIKTAIAQG